MPATVHRGLLFTLILLAASLAPACHEDSNCVSCAADRIETEEFPNIPAVATAGMFV